MKVLFVEDEKVIRRWLESVIREHGCEVAAFADAETAWEACRGGEAFDLFVLDWVLPGMQGPELCRRIRGLPDGELAMILMLTARDKAEDLHKALDAGADDYLVKPIDTDLLGIRLTIAEREIANRRARKRAEDELRDLVERRRVMAEVGISVSRVHTVEEASRAIVDAGVRIGRADVCRIFLADGDGSFSLRAEAFSPGVADEAGGGARGDEEERFTRFRADEGIGARVLEGGRCVVIEDVAEEPRWIAAPWARRLGLGSYTGFPIRRAGEVMGIFSLYRKGRRPFVQGDLDALDVLAGYASISVENARLHEAERSSRGFLQSIVGDSGDAIVVFDEAQKILLWNRGAEQMFGYPREEAEGARAARLLVPEGRRNYLEEIFARTSETGGPHSVETRCYRRSGEPISVGLTVSPVRYEGREAGAMACIFRDLTERKDAEEALARVNQSLEEKNKDLETVFQVASHDLRSPLVNIEGYSKELTLLCNEIHSLLFEETDLPALREKIVRILEEEIPETLRFILAGASKMDLLLAGLMRFSRLGRAALDIDRLDMNQLVRRIVQAMEFQIRESGAVVEVDALPPCRGDEGHVVQVFSNLLDNAVKYRDPSRPGRIRVSGRREGGYAVFCVQDNGLGIPRAHQAKIFEIFHRLDQSKGLGEGLGLTLALRIVERMYGKIWVESEPGEGSSFYVALPHGGSDGGGEWITP